jgi:hypothetical protein
MRRVITIGRVLTLCTLILFVCGCTSNSAPPDEAPLARGAAEDFLIAMGPVEHKELNQKADALTTKKFKRHARWWYEFKSWSITSQTMNPNLTEATVRGTVQATRRYNGDVGSDFKDAVGFRMQLVKDQGKWLVEDIEFGAAPVEEKK